MVNYIRKISRAVLTVLVTFSEILISLLITILLIPPVGLAVLINETVRLFVAAFLRMKYGSRVQLISDGADSIWSFKTAGNSRLTLTPVFYRNELVVEKHRQQFNDCVINYKTSSGYEPYKKFTKIFTRHCGYNCWQQDQFDIANHVRYYPGSENKIVTETELLEKILPELHMDIDESKPQWEEVIIPKFQFDSASSAPNQFTSAERTVSVSVFRYHHGYMDGCSTLLMWSHCLSEGREFPYPVDPFASSKIAGWKRLVYNVSCILLGTLTAIRNFLAFRTVTSRFHMKEYSGNRHFSWSHPFNIQELKEIRSATKTSLPAVLAVAIAGALKTMDEMYPSNKEEFRNISSELHMGLVGALLPYPNIHPRNRYTVLQYAVNIGVISRLQRLQLANDAMGKLLRSPSPYVNFFLLKFFGRFPQFIIQNAAKDSGNPIVFTNIPFTTRAVKFGDNEVIELAGYTPLLTGTGIGIATVAHNNQMRVCGVADEACVSEKELKFLISEVYNEIRLLTEECSQIGIPQQILLHNGQTIKKLSI